MIVTHDNKSTWAEIGGKRAKRTIRTMKIVRAIREKQCVRERVASEQFLPLHKFFASSLHVLCRFVAKQACNEYEL